MLLKINSIFDLFMKFLKSSVMLRLLIYSDFTLIFSCWEIGVLHSALVKLLWVSWKSSNLHSFI